MLRRVNGVWRIEQIHFRGLYSAEAAAVEAGLKPGVDYLITERSWAPFIMKELNNVGHTGKPTAMSTDAEGCNDHIS